MALHKQKVVINSTSYGSKASQYMMSDLDH